LTAIPCAEGVVVDTFERYLVRYVWFHVAFTLCSALLLYAHLAWLVAWLSCLPCRDWCDIIIIATSHSQCGRPMQARLAQHVHIPWGCGDLGDVGAVALAMAGVLPRGLALLLCSLDYSWPMLASVDNIVKGTKCRHYSQGHAGY
jgi:hypothetical protein